MQRYLLSDLNPGVWPLRQLAPAVKQWRRPVRGDNPWMTVERCASNTLEILLNAYRDQRDLTQEFMFRLAFDNPWMRALFGTAEAGRTEPAADRRPDSALEQELWRQAMLQGGFADAVIRIVLAVMGTNRTWSREQFRVAGKIVKFDERLRDLNPAALKRAVKRQAALLAYDRDLALNTLADLLPEPDNRTVALEIAGSIATADLELDDDEQAILERIEEILRPSAACG